MLWLTLIELTGRIADDPPADKLKRLRSHKPSNKVTKPGQKLDIHGNQYTAGDPSAPLAVKAIYAVWDENKGAIPYVPNKPDPRSRHDLHMLQLDVMKLIEQGKINPAEVERIMKSTVSEGTTSLNEASDIDKLADMAVANANTIGEILRRLTALEDKVS